MAYILETRQLTKTYGSDAMRVEALRGVDLQVSAGEMVAIMGPSGSGKSTLLSLLGAVDTPSTGQILLEGSDLTRLSDNERTLIRRRRLGFIFQAFNLLPMLTAEENVALPLELDGVSAPQARQRAEEMLALVQMEQRGGHLPGMLSGGEQQRVAVARALAIRPVLLLADEPTGNLDSLNGERVTALIRDLVDRHAQTVILVTHDAGIAAQADRVIHLRDGLIEKIRQGNRGREPSIADAGAADGGAEESRGDAAASRT